MIRQFIAFLVIIVVMTLGGIYVGRMTAGSATPKQSESSHDDGGASTSIDFSPEALASMGVRVAKLEARSFVAYQEILGEVIDGPPNHRSLTAGLGGQITELLVAPGQTLEPGDAILTYVRDPLPRPEIELTAELVSPRREGTHERVAELRRTREELNIYRAEVDRVARFSETKKDELPVLPRQDLIDLRYQLMRAQRAYDQAALELEEHGHTDEDIERAAQGSTLPNLGPDGWLRALEHNGLWTELAAELYESLPVKLRSDRWVIATVAEITAAGFVNRELVTFFAEHDDAARRFMDCASLLQRGVSIAELKLLYDLGALETRVTLRAPEGASWDLVEIGVFVGQRVEKGDRLALLADPRSLRLRIVPVGSEEPVALAAMNAGAACVARPLIEGTGPVLNDLRLVQAQANDEQGTTFWMPVENRALEANQAGEGARFRSWELRPGLSYMVGIPRKRIEEAYVLPVSAVARRGSENLVFVENGDSFRAVPVVIVERSDREVVIPIAGGGALFPGDPIAMSGAYAISVALASGAANIDPHAGHSH